MKTKLILLGMLCISIVSCSIDKSGLPQPASSTSIVGKWTHTKIVLVDANNKPLDVTTLSDPKDYIQFNADGTGISSDNQSGTLQTQSFTYKISQNNISLISPSETDSGTITTLTANSLVIHLQLQDLTTHQLVNQFSDNYYTK